jgi:glycine cleavage system H protein
MKIIDGLRYSGDHEWVKAEGKSAYIGITDHAQHALGDIVYVELPEIGSKIDKDAAFGVVESVKSAFDVYLPVSGTVVDVNETLVDEPGLLNSDAFEDWIVRVEMDDPGELNRLMDAADYEKFCSER